MADGATLKFKTDRWERFLVKMPFELTREETPLALKRLVFDALNRIISRTPVDTGRAQAGWIPYMEANGSPVTIKGNQSDISQGRSEGSYNESFHGSKLFIEITNGVPYILFLEYGSSGQAPTGMVRITMRELAGKKMTAEEMGMAVKKAARKAGAR